MKITGGLFTVDVSDYTDKGYVCQKNTNAATKEAYPYTVVPETVPISDGGCSSAIQVSNPQNGTVIINKKNAAPGSTVTVIAKPDDGYEIDAVSIVDKNGKKVEVKELGDGRYSFTMPEEDVSISVTFKPVVEEKHENDFADVKSGDYYYEAVLWAAENGVTKGMDNTHFAPDKPTTRAQVVTFLWRAAGSPEPTGTENGFTDLVTGAYYEKAVAWAVEKGITKGTGATAFSPEAVCTRGQIVTFLARFAGVSDTDTESVFSDVNASDFFAAAVRWAKDNGVTDGISKEKFGPELTCTRAQVVTFLYRWMVR